MRTLDYFNRGVCRIETELVKEGLFRGDIRIFHFQYPKRRKKLVCPDVGVNNQGCERSPRRFSNIQGVQNGSEGIYHNSVTLDISQFRYIVIDSVCT